MSYEDGRAAIYCEMPDIIPRTEYSAAEHWKLIEAVTGIHVTPESPREAQARATQAFMKAWDYGMSWSILTYNQIFNGKFTRMGHAEYAAGGVDRDDRIVKLFDDPEDVYGYDLWEAYGVRDHQTLVREYNENYRAQQAYNLDCVSMTGIYVTCMSGLIELLGWDTLLTAAGMDPEAFGDFINRYCRWIEQYYLALADSDAPVVMLHDDIVWTSGAFLHPDFYRRFIFPNYKRLFTPLLEAGKRILFTSDGNYTEFVDDIAPYVHGFVMEPSTDLRYVCEKYGQDHAIIGNADTSVLLFGSREEIEGEVRRCMELGRRCPGFMLAVGNHIPANTPVESALWYDECYRRMRRR